MMEEPTYDVAAMKERLMKYREAEKEIDGQIKRLERLTAKMSGAGVAALSDMPKAHNASSDRIADMVGQKQALDSSVRLAILSQADERANIETILNQLRKSDERMVIRMRYIDGESWSGVNDMMFGGREDFDDKKESYQRRVFQVHGNALIHMAQLAVEVEYSQK